MKLILISENSIFIIYLNIIIFSSIKYIKVVFKSIKRFSFLASIFTILSFSLGTSALFLDKLQAEVLNKDFNIVLITIDTLRADHLSCYGYQRKTSPNIDNIARKGILYTNAIATSPWTSPSMASIMTSLYPISHGVKHGFIKSGKVYKQEILNEEIDTLAEILKNHGYTTFGAVANVHMVKELGFAQGFDYYYCEDFDDASVINDVIFSWKDKIKKSKKFFLWVHYFDPHDYYHARSPWINDYAAELWIGNTDLSKKTMVELKKLIPIFEKKMSALEYLIALYDSEISYVDYHIGHLIYKLELDKSSLIIITSDHGEEFLDHGSLGHSHTLYQELIRVPLIIKLPFNFKDYVNKVVDESVSIIDIMPTILGLLGITAPSEIKGKNLLEKKKLLQGQKHNCLFSELSKRKILKTILRKNWKYVYNYWTQKAELYNITKDHKELKNLISQETSIAKELKRELLTWVLTSPKAPSIKRKVKPAKEIEDKLKALGYISNEEHKELKQSPKDCKSITDESL